MRPVDLTELERAERWVNEHREILREIGEHWVMTGEWMTVDELGRAAFRRDEDADVFAALRNLPPALGRVERPEDTVLLRVRGLALTPSAEPLIAEFVRVLRLAVLRLKSDEERPKICRADLTETLHLGPQIATQVGAIVLLNDWMFGGGSGTADSDWERVVDERTRAIAPVRSIDDYLALEGQRFWSRPAAVLRRLSSSQVPPAVQRDSRAVAVAYGRDDNARQAVFQFLRALGLKPLEWEQLVAETRSAAPYSGEAVEQGFAAAQEVVPFAVELRGGDPVIRRRSRA